MSSSSKMSMIKYKIHSPESEVMILENCSIDNKTIYVNEEIYSNRFLPTMWHGWDQPQPRHIRFKMENTNTSEQDDIKSPHNNDILYIFDTWGTSSYYHLLIDHFFPLWTTKKYIESFLSKQLKIIGTPHYYRVSNNDYHPELPTIKYIFQDIFKKPFVENIKGKFKYIVFGYFYNHRPFATPFQTVNELWYPTLQEDLNEFIVSQRNLKNEAFENKYILIPTRETRQFQGINTIFQMLKESYNVKLVDFGKYTFKEQIELCESAWALVGCEGAAFSNQIFMDKKSLVVCIVEDGCFDGTLFHSAVGRYMEHDFKTIYLTNSTENDVIEFPIGLHTDPEHLLLVPKDLNELVKTVKSIFDKITNK